MKNRALFWCMFCYAMIVLLMGISATRSPISQTMGIIFGIGLLICTFLLYSNNKWSLPIGLTLTAILAITFIARYALTRKPWLAAMALFSGAIVILIVVRLVRWRK